MLVFDRHHKPWLAASLLIAAVAIACYVIVGAKSADGITASSAAGLIFGVVALLFMMFATMLWVNRWCKKGWFLLRRKTWLRGHIWLGLLSVLFVFLHAGFHAGGLLTQVLWVLTLATIVTGVFGWVMQQILPRLLSVQVEGEVPDMQMEHVCNELRRNADIQMENGCGWEVIDDAIDVASKKREFQPSEDDRAIVARFYAVDVRPFLQMQYQSRSPVADRRIAEAAFGRLRAMQLSDNLGRALDEVERLCERRRYLATQARLQRWLHSWLMMHVPISLALLVLGIVHAIASLYY